MKCALAILLLLAAAMCGSDAALVGECRVSTPFYFGLGAIGADQALPTNCTFACDAITNLDGATLTAASMPRRVNQRRFRLF